MHADHDSVTAEGTQTAGDRPSRRKTRSEAMPALGCNYSPQLMTLLRERRVGIDWIKLSRWETFGDDLGIARPIRPVLLHVLPRAGILPPLQPSWDELNTAVEACGSPHVALHLEARPTDWEAPVSDREVIERMVAVTTEWAMHMQVPLIMENVPFYGHRGTLRIATDPDVMREVCERAGVDVLLDLGHARVTAWHRGENVKQYVAALPLDRVRETHVSGPAHDPSEGLRDGHLEMQEEDYALLSWVLERAAPAIVSLEYGGTGPLFEWRSDIGALERQLDRLRHICR